MIQMPKTKKINPKRIPRTEADCYRELKRGLGEGIKTGLTFALFTLVDNELLDTDQLEHFKNRLFSAIECYNKRTLTINDIKQILKEEYDWIVSLNF